MRSPIRTWVVSATAIAGVVGGGVAAATVTGTKHPAPTTTTPTTRSVPDAAAAAEVAQLRTRVAALLAEEQRLRTATKLAQHRLRAQVAHSQRIIQQSAVAAPAPAPPAAAVVTAPAPAPAATHTTSGASGAHGGDGEHEGGHDD